MFILENFKLSLDYNSFFLMEYLPDNLVTHGFKCCMQQLLFCSFVKKA